MHFHLPKPLHGWRQFAGEVGIIVIGVLIALGAEQVVESIHERSEVGELRRALRAELADTRARWESMRDGDDCSLKRLDAIDRWARTAPPGARLQNAFSPMLWNMHSSAWDVAKTSAAAQHFPLDERLLYGSLYSAVDNWRVFLNDERGNAMQLGALAATADQPEHRREIAMRVDMARQFIVRRHRNYAYFFTRLDALRIRPDASQLTITNDPQALCKPPDSAG
jgi:hypothetical protein